MTLEDMLIQRECQRDCASRGTAGNGMAARERATEAFHFAHDDAAKLAAIRERQLADSTSKCSKDCDDCDCGDKSSCDDCDCSDKSSCDDCDCSDKSSCGACDC